MITIAEETLDSDSPHDNTDEEGHNQTADDEEVLVLGPQGLEGDLTHSAENARPEGGREQI